MKNRLPVQDSSIGQAAKPPSPQRDLDRLVDGDLPPSERRQMLAALADEPGGWQRCALAFLEAQSWRKACRQLATEPSGSAPTPPALAQPAWRRRSARRVAASIVAAAAVLGLVFCGGLAAGRAWTKESPQMAGPQSPSDGAGGDSTPGIPQTALAQQDGGGKERHEARTIVQLLGFLHVPGEDGARHAVPILAAPGLKVDAPQRAAATLAVGAPAPGRSERQNPVASVAGLDGEPLAVPLAAGQRFMIPADWVGALAQGPGPY